MPTVEGQLQQISPGILYFKLLLILSDAIGFYVTFSPPNRPPSADQLVPAKVLEIFMQAIFSYAPAFIQLLFQAVTLVEAAATVATFYPGTPLSDHIHSTLYFNSKDLPGFSLTTFFLLGSLLAISGGILRWWCYRTLGKHYTFQLSVLKDHKLVTDGPYNLVRHPGYTGGVAVITSAFLTHGARGSWVIESGILETAAGKMIIGSWAFLLAFVAINSVVRVKVEDDYLKKHFGKSWEQWARRVRYRLIPWVI